MVRDLSPALGILPPFQSCSERQVCFIEGRRRAEWFLKISVNYLLGAQAVPDKAPPLREDLVADFSSGKKEKWNSGYLLYCLIDFFAGLQDGSLGKLGVLRTG